MANEQLIQKFTRFASEQGLEKGLLYEVLIAMKDEELIRIHKQIKLAYSKDKRIK